MTHTGYWGMPQHYKSYSSYFETPACSILLPFHKYLRLGSFTPENIAELNTQEECKR